MRAFLFPAAAMALIAGCSSGGSAAPEAANAQAPDATDEPTALPPASDQVLPKPEVSGGPEPVAVKDPATDARYAGRWVGVEGMFMNVTPRGDGRFDIEMQYDLDNRVTVIGYSTGDGLAIPRGGELLVARPTDGDATGLKYLAGKTDCLTVKPGEGYCRA